MAFETVLMTYPNRLAGSIELLTRLLDGPLADLFAGVHVLPFFTPVNGADAGFDPVDHRQVDPLVGTWDDVAALSRTAEVWADLIVNHVSDASPGFLDYVRHGDASEFAGMFHTFESIFPHGAREADLLAIFRPRPGLPLTVKVIAGRPRLLWTTFTEHQIDVDLSQPVTWAYLAEVLQLMATHGVRHVRLDAVGYVAKTAGTSCFLTDDTYRIIDRLTALAHEVGLTVLAEAHTHHRHQAELARHVDRVYDFALPPLLLHAVHSGDVAPVLRWLDVRPANAVTVLDTHDGIGVVDVGPDKLAADPDGGAPAGLLTTAQVDALVTGIHRASRGVSERATGAAANNVDLYQVNCTWYDALGRDDARMCLTRLIQLFTPGVPHVYYVGLLAGGNDTELLTQTGVGRDVNRHWYRPGEIQAALRRPVVAATLAAIRLRNTHPAFDGRFSAGPGPDPGSLWMRWSNGSHRALLEAVPRHGTFTLTFTDPDTHAQGEQVFQTVLGLARLAPPSPGDGEPNGRQVAGSALLH